MNVLEEYWPAVQERWAWQVGKLGSGLYYRFVSRWYWGVLPVEHPPYAKVFYQKPGKGLRSLHINLATGEIDVRK